MLGSLFLLIGKIVEFRIRSRIFWSAEFEFPWLFGVLNFAIAQAIWLAVDVYSDWINRRLDGNKEPV
jgi:hypothetical protein